MTHRRREGGEDSWKGGLVGKRKPTSPQCDGMGQTKTHQGGEGRGLTGRKHRSLGGNTRGAR